MEGVERDRRRSGDCMSISAPAKPRARRTFLGVRVVRPADATARMTRRRSRLHKIWATEMVILSIIRS